MSKPVDPAFDAAAFCEAIPRAHAALGAAENYLRACGIPLPGTHWHSNMASSGRLGDGHTAAEWNRMKESEDPAFRFLFTWIKGPSAKGWTTHYQPKHPPLSENVASAFEFLGIRRYAECPHFEFEPCYWRHTPFEENGRSVFDSNADTAHRWFDAQAENFSAGIEQLLEADRLIRQFGMQIVPQRAASSRAYGSRIVSQDVQGPARKDKLPARYDVALSFAGSERQLAEQLATTVRDAGFEVFYDNFYPDQLWGKDLPSLFSDVYRNKARYCVIFVSSEYAARAWTVFERRHAVSRLMKEKGNEYILPVRVDETELLDIPDTIGYLSLREWPIDKIAEFLVKKLSA